MAVNYGLGGFQNGSAYGYFSSKTLEPRTFSSTDEYEVIKNVFVAFSYLNISLDQTNRWFFDINASGTFYVKYSITTKDNNGDNFNLGVSINENIPAANTICAFNSKQNDEFTTTSSCLMYIEKGQTINLAIANTTGTDKIDIINANITIIRIGSINTAYRSGFGSGEAFINLRYSGADNFSYAATNTYYPFNFSTTAYNSDGINYPTNNLKIIQNGFYLIDWNIACSGSSNQDLQMGLLLNGNTDAFKLNQPKQI